MRARLQAWPLEVRLVAVLALVVALGAGALSWSALTTFAAGARIDEHLRWVYPVVVDGVMAVGTVAAVVLRSARRRTRAYVWTLLVAAIGVSLAGNAAHASGAVLPDYVAALASAVPAAALAASLHLMVVIVRASAPPAARARPAGQPPPFQARRRRAGAPKVVYQGREMSAGHARKLRARARSEGEHAAAA